jgi:acetoin utilization deacetylase AcuC-like enzyme
MNTILFTHPICLQHDTGPGHPERAERLRAILSALETEPFALLIHREARQATLEEIARMHPMDHVKRVLAAVPEHGYYDYDADTTVSPASAEAALRSAGACCEAVEAVFDGDAHNAFCAVRPPGHHAERTRPMGFCLFNNIAIGAAHARAKYGIKRVAVIDFDVHHGNGTQNMFKDDPDLFYGSTHQMPLYPGTGTRNEHGVADNIHNAPMPPHAGSPEFRAAMSGSILPALEAFKPELVMISAGFDAHMDDPLANLNLTRDDYAWVTAKLLDLAARHCKGRLVSTLEGGYDLRALTDGVTAHVKELMTA